jgi:hypothetical protein
VQSPAALAQRCDLAVALINAERRRALIEADAWEDTIRSGAEWALRLDDDFELPTEPRLDLDLPATAGIGDRLTALRTIPRETTEAHRAAGRAARHSVRAKNRPDDWDRLMADRAA